MGRLWITLLLATAATWTGCGRGDRSATEGGANPAPDAGNAARSGPAKVAESAYTTTPSGVKYAILTPGEGPAATDQQVAIHHTGWLEDGRQFDTSGDRDRPFMFPLGHGEALKGWDEGVKGMKVGEKRQLVIPPALGYGAAGSTEKGVPPNATLIYQIVLVQIGPEHHHEGGAEHERGH
jgi:FKBP-type peptidyl-prolyl cis-trans isomerase